MSKTTGVPLAKVAVKLMLGRKLKEFGLTDMKKFPYISVKEAVLPFNKFIGVDTLLTPEMRSTGEVMGISNDFGESFYKASLSAGDRLPIDGTIFLSINRRSKEELLNEVKSLHENGFKLVATEGTALFYNDHGIPCEKIKKVSEGRPNIIDLVKNDDINLIVNTPAGKISKNDAYHIRQTAVRSNIPIMTTISAAKAAIHGMLEVKRKKDFFILPIQEYHKKVT